MFFYLLDFIASEIYFLLYSNISELYILQSRQSCPWRSYGNFTCMNFTVTVHIFITSLEIYTISIPPVEFNCYFKMSSETLHYNLALKQKFTLNAKSHGSRAPSARQMFDIGAIFSKLHMVL